MVDLKQGAVMVQVVNAVGAILDCEDEGTVDLVPGRKGGKPEHYALSFDVGGHPVTFQVPTEAANEFASKILALPAKDTSASTNGSVEAFGSAVNHVDGAG